MSVADAAIATSGTVTLEAALCGLPAVIVYKTSPLTALIARLVIRVDNIGLPNIVAGRRILPELLQEEASAGRIADALLALLAERCQAERDLAQMKERLGGPGAVGRVARLVLAACGAAAY
jgi:lipid-A-disaccharide synthase